MRILVLFFITIPVISLGQISKVDFENNDLTGWYQNILSRWEISNINPIDGSGSLHHAFDNTENGTDWIAYFYPAIDLNKSETTWEFSIRYDHNPSSSNNWAVFLSSSDLPYSREAIEDALIFGVNYTGNDDKISFWRQHYRDVECIYSSDFNWEEKIRPGNIVSFKITRSTTGTLSVKADTIGSSYFLIGETSESEIDESNCFILYYKYTATYDRGLAFDNLRITGIAATDIVPLNVTSVQVVSSQQVEVSFNKIVQISEPYEFCVEGAGCGVAEVKAGRNFLVNLPYILRPGNHYTLHLPEFTDMMGNIIYFDTPNITFYYPAIYDILINEIMADPTPAVMLPETEYLELFNRSAEKISLKGWHLSENNSSVILPDFILDANQYVVICGKDSASKFLSENNQVIGIDNFPAINNESCEIILSDRSNRLIHSVNYSNDWLKSSYKKEGGWSAEMINFNDPCKYSGNWGESLDSRGGTPGYPNSILNNNSDIDYPKLDRAAVTDSESLMLYFSEPLDSNSLIDPNYYFIDHDIGQPIKIIPSWPIANIVELFFNKKFEPKVSYEISLTYDVKDCIGNTFSETQRVSFERSEQADSAEVLINEIMYNPTSNIVEFIELYNNSMKTIDLRNWMIAIGDTSTPKKMLTSNYFPLPPNGYVILVKNLTDIADDNLDKIGNKIISMDDFPQLSNEGNIIYLYNNFMQMTDAALYSPDFQNLLIQNSQGVSLERISSQISGLDPNNWQSASSDAGYMTPAAINSQNQSSDPENNLNIKPSTISPDGDDNDDELEVSYKLISPGFMGRVLIFDASGNLVFTLLNGGLLGTEGKFIFDGKNKDGRIFATGYYVLFFDAYKQGYKRYTVKKAFVVASEK